VKEVEPKPSATNWGNKMTFGNAMAEFSTGGGTSNIQSGCQIILIYMLQLLKKC